MCVTDHHDMTLAVKPQYNRINPIANSKILALIKFEKFEAFADNNLNVTQKSEKKIPPGLSEVVIVWLMVKGYTGHFSHPLKQPFG